MGIFNPKTNTNEYKGRVLKIRGSLWCDLFVDDVTVILESGRPLEIRLSGNEKAKVDITTKVLNDYNKWCDKNRSIKNRHYLRNIIGLSRRTDLKPREFLEVVRSMKELDAIFIGRRLELHKNKITRSKFHRGLNDQVIRWAKSKHKKYDFPLSPKQLTYFSSIKGC